MWKYVLAVLFTISFGKPVVAQPNFVKTSGHQFLLNNKPFYYVGTNYWYGGFLGIEKDNKRGIERLRKELDFLKSKGVINLRVVAGVEGAGQINGVERVKPALQISKGKFNIATLNGLDVLLAEMGKRDMKAVLYLSNNWEWSGGFLQYLNWNGLIEDSVVQRKMEWDELRDQTSKFYNCNACVADYLQQVKLIVTRTNKVTGKKYNADPAIMAWELANEPRPMRPSANEAYMKWIKETSTFIKSLDKNHLVTIGHEGDIGVEGNMELYQEIHAYKNIDYLTIHIWPKNWAWFRNNKLEEDYDTVRMKTLQYINRHAITAKSLAKPLVIEEFGLPRDGHSFNVSSSTKFRDSLYNTILAQWAKSKETNDVIAGINFWAFGGMARPKPDQIFWKIGDDYMGDPPMEEQGLNTVFDSDLSTWKIISDYTGSNTSKSSTPKSRAKNNVLDKRN